MAERTEALMDMNGSHRIPAPLRVVWAALNDPEILRRSIPGCETIEKHSETDYTATLTAKVGPIKAKFAGKVTLTDVTPPLGYTLNGEGSGGVAGFARGTAGVRLTPDGQETLLEYTVKAQVGGKLAQLGQRLIDATARAMAEDFFTRFADEVTRLPALPETTPETDSKRRRNKLPWLLAVAGALAGAAALYLLFRR